MMKIVRFFMLFSYRSHALKNSKVYWLKFEKHRLYLMFSHSCLRIYSNNMWQSWGDMRKCHLMPNGGEKGSHIIWLAIDSLSDQNKTPTTTWLHWGLGIRTCKCPDSEARKCLGNRTEKSGYAGLGLAIRTQIRIPRHSSFPITEKSTFLGFCSCKKGLVCIFETYTLILMYVCMYLLLFFSHY